MPTTKSLEILQGVIVSGLDMVGLIRGRTTEDAERVAGLALVAVAPQDAEPTGAPVRRESSLTRARGRRRWIGETCQIVLRLSLKSSSVSGASAMIGLVSNTGNTTLGMTNG